MAYPALAQKDIVPLFDNIMEQKVLQVNLFAFYFTKKADEDNGMLSDLTFGYYDKAKFTGEIHWLDVEFKYMYGVKFEDIKFNGISHKLCQGDNECLVTFDSGTSKMAFPMWAAKLVNSNGIPIGKVGEKCQSEKSYGDLTIIIGGKDYVLSNEDWM